jgi:hypothetical protein
MLFEYIIILVLLMGRKSDSLPLDSLSVNSCGSACSCSTDNTLGRSANQAAAAATTTNHTAAVATDQVAVVEPTGGDLRESRRVKVEYLGSIPVENKATDLRSLQVGQSSTTFNVVVFILWITWASHLPASTVQIFSDYLNLLSHF